MKRFIISLIMCLSVFPAFAQKVDNSTVKVLDLDKFLGRWFEIAKFDHKFERGMDFVTTEYSMMEDGHMKVINCGIKNDDVKVSVGEAKLTDVQGLLKVSFFKPFYSDYRVMMVSDDYMYALIGSGGPDHLWIMSRTPHLDSSVSSALVKEASSRGYDTSKLIWIDQTLNYEKEDDNVSYDEYYYGF